MADIRPLVGNTSTSGIEEFWGAEPYAQDSQIQRARNEHSSPFERLHNPWNARNSDLTED